MKSEKEIRKELKDMTEWLIEQVNKHGLIRFPEAIGFISALKWVLEDEDKKELKR